MFISLLVIAFFLISLFFLSRKISTAIYLLTYVLTRSKTASLAVLTTLLLPGTIIHELSHFFVSLVLLVPTGELSVFPTVEKDGTIRAGRLMIGKVDPFRHTFVGLAPIFVGLALIGGIENMIVSMGFILDSFHILIGLAALYILFVTSITMFSSKKDVESVFIAGPIIILFVVALYRVGLRISLNENLTQKTEQILHILALSLLFTAVADLIIYFGILLFTNAGKRFFRLKFS